MYRLTSAVRAYLRVGMQLYELIEDALGIWGRHRALLQCRHKPEPSWH